MGVNPGSLIQSSLREISNYLLDNFLLLHQIWLHKLLGNCSAEMTMSVQEEGQQRNEASLQRRGFMTSQLIQAQGLRQLLDSGHGNSRLISHNCHKL